MAGTGWRRLLASPYLMLALLFAAYVVSLIDRFLIGVLVDPMKAHLGLSDTQISLLQGVGFLAVYSVAGLGMGWLADRTHRPRLIAGAMIVWTLATAFCGATSSIFVLFALRSLVAVGEAALLPAGMSLVAERFPPRRLGLAIVSFGLGGAIGGGVSLAVGGAVYGWLASIGGIHLPWIGHLQPWQGTFFLVALPGLPLAILIALIFDPRQRQPGSVAQKGAVRAFFAQGGQVIIPLMLAMSCMNAVLTGMVYWSAPLFVRAHGWSIQEAGAAVGMVLIAGSFVGSLGGGVLSDRLAADSPGKRLMLCVPAGLVALLAGVALGWVSLASGVLICLGILQASILLVMGMGTIALQAIAPAHIRGSMTAILTTCTSLVGALAPTAIGLLNDRVFGTGAGIATSVTLFFSAMLLLALLLLLRAQMGFAALVRSREEPSTQ